MTARERERERERAREREREGEWERYSRILLFFRVGQRKGSEALYLQSMHPSIFTSGTYY